MKKIILPIFLIILFLSSGLSFAQNNQKQKEQKNQQVQVQVKAKLTIENQNQVRNNFQVMTLRLEKAIERLEILIIRIESHLEKLEENGQKVDSIKKEVEKAKLNLEKAKSDLSLAQIKIEELLESDNPKQSFKEVKTLILSVKTQLIEVHQILVHIIGEIKGLKVGQNP